MLKTKFDNFLTRQASIRPLSCFRFLFGLWVWHYITFYRPTEIIYEIYINPDFLFSYPLFDFLKLSVLPAEGLLLIFRLLQVSAFGIALGLFFRLSSILFFAGYSYVFLLDQSYSTPHNYLVLLISFLLMIGSSHRSFSFDAFLFKNARARTVPYWQTFVFRVQLILVFFFAALTKLHFDWLSLRLPSLIFQDFMDWVIVILAYGSLIAELLIVLFLSKGKSRLWGIALVYLHQMLTCFYIGHGMSALLILLTMILFIDDSYVDVSEKYSYKNLLSKRGVGLFVCLYLGIQIILPFRPYLFPGDVTWNKKGHDFSWRFLADKNNGHLDIQVKDRQSAQFWRVPLLHGINSLSYGHMATHPDLILQYVQWINARAREKGFVDPQIILNSYVSLNGRNFARFMNPDLDYAQVLQNLQKEGPLLLDHPDKAGTTDIAWNQFGKFFSPAYQIAVFDNANLLAEDAQEVKTIQKNLDELSARFNVSHQKIADDLTALGVRIEKERKNVYAAGQLLEFLMAYALEADSYETAFQALIGDYLYGG